MSIYIYIYSYSNEQPYLTVKKPSSKIKLFALLSSAGTALCCCVEYVEYSFRSLTVSNWSDENYLFTCVYILICALLSVFFLFVLNSWIYSHIAVSAKKMLSDMTKSDKICLITLFILFVLFIFYVFSSSYAYYGGDIRWDIIYSFDSPDIMNNCAYLWLGYFANDIRHPLFAIFSAPFLGIPYLILFPFREYEIVTSLLFAWVQLAMLLLSYYMLSRLLKFNSFMRTAFIIFCSCTYCNLLFSIAMEKYIISTFWLIFFIYCVFENKDRNLCVFIGAMGTLFINVLFFPLLSEKKIFKEFKEWFTDVFRCALISLGFIAISGQMDCIFDAVNQVIYLSRFASVSISFTEKLKQYSYFAECCFLAPQNTVIEFLDYACWNLSSVEAYSVFGFVIILISVVGFAVSYKEKISQASFLWLLFSFVLLVIFGWGAVQNSMVLYSLAFSWAYYVLVFKFLEFISEKMKFKSGLPYFTVILTALLLIINIPRIIDMIDFTAEYYPAFNQGVTA